MAYGPGIANSFLQPIFKKAKNNALAGYDKGIAQLNTSYDQAKNYQQPWQDFGQNALKGFQAWSTDPNAVSSDPSYQFRLNQEQNSLENSAAAHGGLLSGNTGRALIDYGQNSASQEYQNQFGRWMQQLGIGQNASSNMTNLSVGQGNALSSLMIGKGNTDFSTTLQSAEEIRKAENDLNNLIQSWVPASAGGGKNTGPASGPSSSPSSGPSSGSSGSYSGSASPSSGNYAGNQNYTGGNSGQFSSYSNSFGGW